MGFKLAFFCCAISAVRSCLRYERTIELNVEFANRSKDEASKVTTEAEPPITNSEQGCYCGFLDFKETTDHRVSGRPWMAMVMGSGSNFSTFCIASLLNQRYLIVSSRCLAGKFGNGNSELEAGFPDGDGGHFRYEIRENLPHPDALAGISLLKTEEKVDFKWNYVFPICLPPVDLENYIFEDMDCHTETPDAPLGAARWREFETQPVRTCHPASTKKSKVTYWKPHDFLEYTATNQYGPVKLTKCSSETCLTDRPPPQDERCSGIWSRKDIEDSTEKVTDRATGVECLRYDLDPSSWPHTGSLGYVKPFQYGYCGTSAKNNEEWGFCLPTYDSSEQKPYLFEASVEANADPKTFDTSAGNCSAIVGQEFCADAVILSPREQQLFRKNNSDVNASLASKNILVGPQRVPYPLGRDELGKGVEMGPNGYEGFYGTVCEDDLGAPIWREYDWFVKGRIVTVVVLVGIANHAGDGMDDGCFEPLEEETSENQYMDQYPRATRIVKHLDWISSTIKDGSCDTDETSITNFFDRLSYDTEVRVREGHFLRLNVHSRDPIPLVDASQPPEPCRFFFPNGDVANVERGKSGVQRTVQDRAFVYTGEDQERDCNLHLFEVKPEDNGEFGFQFGFEGSNIQGRKLKSRGSIKVQVDKKTR